MSMNDGQRKKAEFFGLKKMMCMQLLSGVVDDWGKRIEQQ